MKLNFWQRLGLLLLAVGVVVVMYERRTPQPGVNPNPPATNLPTTHPIP